MWQAELTALERCYAAVMIALYKSLVLHSRCEESLVNNRSTVDQSSPVTRFSPLCFYWRNSVRLISWNNGAFSSHQSHYSMQSSCACHTFFYIQTAKSSKKFQCLYEYSIYSTVAPKSFWTLKHDFLNEFLSLSLSLSLSELTLLFSHFLGIWKYETSKRLQTFFFFFHSYVIEEPFWFPKEPFSEQLLALKSHFNFVLVCVKNILMI